jgi:hypothetical protein
MASRHKLASSTHYKTSAKLSRSIANKSPSAPSPAAARASKALSMDNGNGSSDYRHKVEIKAEAKEIMERCNKLTSDYRDVVSVIGGESELVKHDVTKVTFEDFQVCALLLL